MDDLAADFAAIYLTGALGASPYESYWLSDDHLICQDAMFDMRTLYAEAGLKVPDWRMRPDDHLVFQLQFLARLLSRRRARTMIGDRLPPFSITISYAGCRILPAVSSTVATRRSMPPWPCSPTCGASSYAI